MIQNNLLDWYEANLPTHERKMRGHFSTPPHLVEQILDACNYTPEHDLTQIRVMDPACGSGNFVAGAARRLIAYGKQAALAEETILRLVQHNIWGFDPDPVACFLAEMQMYGTFASHNETGPKPDNSCSDTRRNRKIGQFHIHQADGLALPRPLNGPQEKPGKLNGHVDLFLANPPYLAAKNNDLSVYRFAQQRGQSDSYLLFLELALQVVRPGGWLGLVLPDPVLARANAARERKRLLAETTVHHLWHLADVFAAYVGAVVIVAQKQPPSPIHAITWRREHWMQNNISNEDRIENRKTHRTPIIHNGDSGTVSQTFLHRQTGAELRYLFSRLQGTLVEHIYTQWHTAEETSHTLILLKDLVLIHRGEEISKDSPLLNKAPTQDEEQKVWYPVLRGGSEIRPYGIPSAQYWIAGEKIVKPLAYYLTPKLLVVKSTGRLQASLDLQGHIVLQTLYTLAIAPDVANTILTANETQADRSEHTCKQNHERVFSVEDELYYLHALLNSRLLQEYVHVLHTAYKWVQPQIEQHVLAHLPLPGNADPSEKAQIIQRAKQMIHSCSESSADVELKVQNQACYEEQEHAICRLYQRAIQEERPAKPAQGLQQEPPPNVRDKGVTQYG